MQTKVCSRCKQEKLVSEFSKTNGTKKDGYGSWCKQCRRDVSKHHRETPSGIYSQINGRQNFYKRHGHWRYKPVLLSRKEFVDWYNIQEKRCFYCKIHENELSFVNDTQNTKATRLTIDCIENHKGYSLDNMVLACGRCNFIKNDFFTHEDMVQIGKVFIIPKWMLMLEQSKTEVE